MIYLKRSNLVVKKNRLTTVAVILLLVLLFGIHFFFPRFYASLFYPLTSLAWKTENSLFNWFGNTSNLIRSKNTLIKEKQKLEEQIRLNEISLLTLDLLKKENENLKLILNRKSEGQLLLSLILNRPPVSPYDTLIIDRGSKHGIALGDKVYALGDVLIGEVAETYPTRSKVDLFSSPGKKTFVLFKDSNTQAEAIGRGGGNFTANLPFESDVKQNELVVLTGLKTNILAVVEEIFTDRSNSFSTVLFKTPININEIHFVEVEITSSKP